MYIMHMNLVYILMYEICFALGVYMLTMSFSKDMKIDLSVIDEVLKLKKSKRKNLKLFKHLNDFIPFHSFVRRYGKWNIS